MPPDQDVDTAVQLDVCLRGVLRDVDDMHHLLVDTIVSICDTRPGGDTTVQGETEQRHGTPVEGTPVGN